MIGKGNYAEWQTVLGSIGSNRNWRKAAWALTAIFLALTNPTDAIACSCNDASLEKSYSSSSVVFTATISQVTLPEEGEDDVRVSFSATEVFKGAPSFTHIRTSRTSCGIRFEVSQEYLVFADAAGVTQKCSGTIATSEPDGQVSEGQLWVNSLRSYNAGISSTLTVPWMYRQTRNGCVLHGDLGTRNASHPSSMTLVYSRQKLNRGPSYETQFRYPTLRPDEIANSTRAPRKIKVGSLQLELRGGELGSDWVNVSHDRRRFTRIGKELLALSQSNGSLEISGVRGVEKQASVGASSTQAIKDFLACLGDR